MFLAAGLFLHVYIISKGGQCPVDKSYVLHALELSESQAFVNSILRDQVAFSLLLLLSLSLHSSPHDYLDTIFVISPPFITFCAIQN